MVQTADTLQGCNWLEPAFPLCPTGVSRNIRAQQVRSLIALRAAFNLGRAKLPALLLKGPTSLPQLLYLAVKAARYIDFPTPRMTVLQTTRIGAVPGSKQARCGAEVVIASGRLLGTQLVPSQWRPGLQW